MNRTVEEFATTSQLNEAASQSHHLSSAVSWSAVLAGAAGAASLSLILLILGTGLGLSSASPWAQEGAGAVALGVSAILWISFTQLAASGVGGYLAGRLRTRWVGTAADEVYFRDTAHGFLAWSVATLLTAGLLSSAIGSTLKGGAEVAATTAGAAAATTAIAAKPADGADSAAGNSTAYFIDSLFRSDAGKKPSADAASPATVAEVGRILGRSLRSGGLPVEDKEYLVRLVAQRADVTQAEAESRVNEVQLRMILAETSAKEASDKARKVSAYTSLWFFISLLLGAFVASYMATFGGRLRDQ